MRLLALETSTERLSVVLVTDTDTFVREIDAGQRHSSLALGTISEVLSDAKLDMASVDAVAFGQGPGSFVGIRIACGLAQGLALGVAKPIIPVATTLALAEQAKRVKEGYEGMQAVLVAIDARLGEFYVAAYVVNEQAPTGWDICVAPMLATAQTLPALAAFVATPDIHCVGVGSAFAVPVLRESLVARYGSQLSRIVEGALPSALDVAHVARRLVDRMGAGAFADSASATPLYLRDKVAQNIEERAASKAAIRGFTVVPS
jgi:tRNA threonylcarbamoyladenosine biosynthesis protein TsaB